VLVFVAVGIVGLYKFLLSRNAQQSSAGGFLKHICMPSVYQTLVENVSNLDLSTVEDSTTTDVGKFVITEISVKMNEPPRKQDFHSDEHALAATSESESEPSLLDSVFQPRTYMNLYPAGAVVMCIASKITTAGMEEYAFDMCACISPHVPFQWKVVNLVKLK
jgi:hypothetical protein